MANIDNYIECLINYINESDNDIIKMRNISNFYNKIKKYQKNSYVTDKLIFYSKKIENERNLNIFNILIFIFSGRDYKFLPNKFNDMIDYRIGNMPLDEDLKKCNIFVYEKEFI